MRYMHAHWARRSKIFYSILLLVCLLVIHRHASNTHKSKRKSFDEIKSLIIQLFDSSLSIRDLQNLWNDLMKIWQEILIEFFNDACQICSKEIQFNCRKSLDVIRYINHINQSFYPLNESARPHGMGLYYFIQLKSSHLFNDSLLPIDVTRCDYFQMIYLLMRTQTILHQINIKYILTKGTLIGTLRHHDIIPWDTDIDLFIPNNTSAILLKYFNSTRQDDLVIYRFRNIYGIISYKIFSRKSPRVNGTDYRWPKIDIFLYQENTTHFYASPKHRHNLGTMSVINRTDIEPINLRLLGPLLVPSPNQPRISLKAMVKLGPSNLFNVCEGNRYSTRDNQQSNEPWRVPCKELQRSYLFVRSKRNSTTNLCEEQLISSSQGNHQPLSFYLYQCNEHLPRTLTKEEEDF